MNEIEKHYRCGQHAALRGLHRMLGNPPAKEMYVAWYAGYDSVPRELRKCAPLTGPIPQGLLDRLAELTCVAN